MYICYQQDHDVMWVTVHIDGHSCRNSVQTVTVRYFCKHYQQDLSCSEGNTWRHSSTYHTCHSHFMVIYSFIWLTGVREEFDNDILGSHCCSFCDLGFGARPWLYVHTFTEAVTHNILFYMITLPWPLWL